MAGAESKSFFKTERTVADIRGELLLSSFEAWAAAMLQHPLNTGIPILFLDFEAGQDGCPFNNTSPPAQILRLLYKSTGTRTDLNRAVKTVFYDTDSAALSQLQEQVEQLPYFPELQHTPVFLGQETAEADLRQVLDEEPAAFTFMNPFRSGFSLKGLCDLLQHGEAGLFVHFTLQDLQVALKKAKTDETLGMLFGERLGQLKDFQKKNRNIERREEYLLDSFESILAEKGCYTFRFRINRPDKMQTGRYLVFASKVEQAYTRLKDIMTQYSDYQEDGVPLFGANLQHQQMSLFQEHYKYSIANLVQDLSRRATDYNNRTVQQVHEMHSIGTHYILENYKEAYEQLLRRGKVRFINPKTGQVISKPTYTSKIRYSA